MIFRLDWHMWQKKCRVRGTTDIIHIDNVKNVRSEESVLNEMKCH